MATVYLAYDRKHLRDVAIKVMRPEIAASIGIDRFLKEIQIVARLVQRFRFLVASKDVGVRHPFKAPVAPSAPMDLFVEEHAGTVSRQVTESRV